MVSFNTAITKDVFVKDSTLHMGGQILPRFRIDDVLGDGANGVVFAAHHILLNQPRALKVWLKLRKSDHRDKVVQGIAEAQKLAAADPEWVAIIYDAEEIGGIFYSSMERISGETLRHRLQRNPSKLDRWWLARLYLNAIRHTTSETTAHGDPHAGNAMVYNHVEDQYNEGTRIKLLDFGTSMFSSPESSRDRHWRIVGETFRLIMNTFEQSDWAYEEAIPLVGRPDYLIGAYYDDVLEGMKIEAGTE